MLLSGTFKKNRWTTLASAAIAATLLTGTGFAENSPSTQPSAAVTTPATPVAGRNLQAIIADFQSSSKAVAAAVGERANLGDAAKRNEMAPAAIPALQQQMTILDELMKQPQIPAAQIAPMKQRAEATLYLLNDKSTVAAVDAMSKSDAPSQVQNADSIKFLSEWMGAGNDAAAQGKLADNLIKMDQAAPTDSKLTSLTYSLSRETADKATASKLSAAATAMKTPMAKALVAQVEAAKKLASLEGKPLVVSGKTPEGKDFTTADWKGKVVLVDFWATWCGPCKAELPRVKKMYSDYHDKGLEILSVSNDYKASTLTDFTAKNGMPWPELYDDAAGSAGKWNPITQGYGINGIPTMFLIDKNGVCRTVEAREKMEDLIPKMLAE